ncbi:hypothetical protein JCM33374_g2422 [Metschnikowia sp. JCM 33374]|nr:hypothetical protein JCM33374_g2422 [Metschnikowia sp. JCM 33374]
MSSQHSQLHGDGFATSPKRVLIGLWHRYGVQVIVPVAVSCVSVLVYMVWVCYFPTGNELSNLDAQRFWKNIHPRLGVSLIPEQTSHAKHTSCQRVCDHGYQEGRYDDHDPRLIPAMWLDFLSNPQNSLVLDHSSGCPGLNGTLPFSWGSFLGLSSSIECSSFSETFSNNTWSREEQKSHMNASKGGSSCDGIPRQISGPIDSPFPAKLRRYIGANYMLHNRQIPPKAVLLGVAAPQALVINLTVEFPGPKSPGENLPKIVTDYLETHPGASEICISEQLKQLKDFLSSYTFNHGRGGKSEEAAALDLMPEEFCGGASTSNTSHLEHFHTKPNTSFGMGEDENAPKYFHEAELLDTHVGFHYDWRFFKTADFSDYDRKVVLHRLAKAWLRFSQSLGLKTWLAHGTLLGWYWNGINLPWDQDIDVQMTYQSLELMAKTHNQSLVVDLTDNPDVAGVHAYFVDVSPHFRKRLHPDKENVVDARFIDVSTGMYVDITGLSTSAEMPKIRETQETPKTPETPKTSEIQETPKPERLLQVFNADYRDIIKSAEHNSWHNMASFHSELAAKATTAWKNHHLYNCKDFHFYDLSELTPLIRTSFEGEVAYVPHNFKAILLREYPKGLSSKSYGDWVYRAYFGAWSRFSRCRNDIYGDVCNDKDMVLEEQYTRAYRLKRGRWDTPVEPFPRVDPFIIRRNDALLGVS